MIFDIPNFLLPTYKVRYIKRFWFTEHLTYTELLSLNHEFGISRLDCIYLRKQTNKSSHNFITLNKDSHQTILVTKLKNCIIISASSFSRNSENFFFRIIAQFQIKNIYLREQTNKSSHNFMTFSHQTILVKKLKIA